MSDPAGNSMTFCLRSRLLCFLHTGRDPGAEDGGGVTYQANNSQEQVTEETS